MCVFVCKCACAFMIANVNVHVYTFMFHLSCDARRLICAVFTTISDIDIGCSFPLGFLLCSLHPADDPSGIENKSKGTQSRINCVRCEINECTKVARSSSVSTLSNVCCSCVCLCTRLFNFGIAYVPGTFFAHTHT